MALYNLFSILARLVTAESDIDTLQSQTGSITNRINGVANAGFVVSGSKLILSPVSGSIMYLLLRSITNGDVLAYETDGVTDYEITLATGTVTGTAAKITTAYFGADPTVHLFAYAINNNGSLAIGLSRSPNHVSVPANYWHTNTTTARTAVGSPSTAWDAMWISVNGEINASNTCVCLGPACSVVIDRTNGRASSMALLSGGVPNWDKRNTTAQVYTPVWTGFSANPAGTFSYVIDKESILIENVVSSHGTSNTTSFSQSLPVPTASGASTNGVNMFIPLINNGGGGSGWARIGVSSWSNDAAIVDYADGASNNNAFTAANGKSMPGTIVYRI